MNRQEPDLTPDPAGVGTAGLVLTFLFVLGMLVGALACLGEYHHDDFTCGFKNCEKELK